MGTYSKAYEDIEFLKRNELRAVRMQTEMLKPQIVMDEQYIQSTICVFGSARTLCPTDATSRLHKANDELAKDPGSKALKETVAHAERMLTCSHDYAVAREFSAHMSKVGQQTGAMEYVICTGGGPGIMEAANRGASDVGAKSIGLNITLPHEQDPNKYISPDLNFLFHYFSVRKMHFLLHAKALCAFPGGFGTMDELFETLTLIQTHKTNKIPVLLFNKEFWTRLVDWDYFVDCGMISAEDLELVHYFEDPEKAVDFIVDFYASENK
ncbi:hypothetical protein BVY04_00630 [bacterium M21]|nr:hypothetical protein BVY04_00630 [bacterium M21]